MPVNELLGCAIAACMASGLTGLLLWIAGSSRGIPPTRLRAMLWQALATVCAALAGLALARWYTGGALFDFDARTPGGLSTRPVGLLPALADLAAVLWALACLWYALRIAHRITGPPVTRTTHADPEE